MQQQALNFTHLRERPFGCSQPGGSASCTGTGRRARAFSLVELAVVVLITGLLAVLAVPALSIGNQARQSAAAQEVSRRLELARSRAMATGHPHGLMLDCDTESIQIMRIASSGATPTPALGPGGAAEPAADLSTLYGGCQLLTFRGGDGSTVRGTIWFGASGVPELRSASGTLTGAWSSDATLALTGGHTITIRRLSGAIEP